jgi:hypothetical protein
LTEIESLRREDKLKFETVRNKCEDACYENERLKDRLRESELMMESMSSMSRRMESQQLNIEKLIDSHNAMRPPSTNRSSEYMPSY